MTKKIIGYIQQNLLGGQNGTQLLPEDDLLGSGLVDSIGMMQLIAFIEEEFKTKVPPEDMVIENFMTVEAIGGYLKNRLIS
ncbi:MAG TPA: acyl carrier protein [Bacteroidetes bacterium]|nr:acyl carrier protein [Bacteroidota bacterium]